MMEVLVYDAEGTSTNNLEIQWLKIKRKNTKTILLANVYRPPHGKLDQAIKTIEKSLVSLIKNNEEVIILGDFNIDYKNMKSPNYKKIKFFERANALEQLISTTTRNTKTSSSLLDIAFTNVKYIKQSGALDSFLSDHQPIFLLKKKMKSTEKSEQNFEGRSYKNYDKQRFMDNLKAQKWNYFFDAQDPMSAWEEMQRIIFREADKQCPVKTYKIRNSKPCWLTNEIIEQMKYRDYFYQKAKKNRDEDDWNIAKFHRNPANFNVRKAKADYIKEQLIFNEGNGAKFWRVIKQVMPNKKGSRNSSCITVCRNNNETIEKKEVAGVMNNYFANLGKITNKTTNKTARDNESQDIDPDPKRTPTYANRRRRSKRR